MQEHLYVTPIRKALLLREILSGFDIGQRQPHGDGLQRDTSPRVAGFDRALMISMATSG